MRAALRTLDSADAPEGLASFAPPDPERFAIAIAAAVGPAGDDRGGELFYFDVLTPTWLEVHPPPKGFEFVPALVVTRWDYETVHRAISDLCSRTEGDDWGEIAVKLSRSSHWELEDYGSRGLRLGECSGMTPEPRS